MGTSDLLLTFATNGNYTVSNLSNYKAICIVFENGATGDFKHSYVPVEIFKLGRDTLITDGGGNNWCSVTYLTNTSVKVEGNTSRDKFLYGIK